MGRRNNRVIYYSKRDLTIGDNLILAESILRTFDSDKTRNINDIIELYNVKLFIDYELFLTRWTEDDKKFFKETTVKMWESISLFWLEVNNDNFNEHFKNLEFEYRPSFWSLVEKFKVYKRISSDLFKEILNSKDLWIREVLQQKNLVNYFGREITEYLLVNTNSAELLLSEFEQVHDFEKKKINFPKSVSEKEKEQIILNYLNSDNPNINYVRLISKSKDSDLKLQPRTRLKAKKLATDLNNRIFEEGTSVAFGTEVSFSPELEEPLTETWEGNTQKLSYSTKWVNRLSEELSLSPIFIALFKYIEFGCISLINKSSELDVLETIFLRSKNEYVTGLKYSRKSNLSHLQLLSYCEFLKGFGRSIENLLLSNVNDYLNRNLGLTNCRITFPSESSTYLEKVRLLVPEIESILKQYKLFVEEGEIDHELKQLSSQPILFRKIPSLVEKKYVYGKGDEFRKLAYWFFSDQSGLSYVKPFESKYHILYSLLINEEVRITDFANYQMDIIDYLVKKGYLYVDSDEYLRIKQEQLIFIIGVLYRHEAVSYWHFSDGYQTVMDSMEKDGLLYYGSTLFTESECRYFNFYLNKAEFTNGLDLRNKYAHGTNTDNLEEHKNDYFILLKLLILILLKIEDDILISYQIGN